MCPSVHPALLLSCLLAASLAYLHECLGSLAVSVILSTGQAAFATCPNQAAVYANPAQGNQRCSDTSAPNRKQYVRCVSGTLEES